jgi:hypothetical protein
VISQITTWPLARAYKKRVKLGGDPNTGFGVGSVCSRFEISDKGFFGANFEARL